MAGSIYWKERAVNTITSSGASVASGTASLAGTMDCRASGSNADDFAAAFTLQCQFATITGIAAGTIIADLYLVPSLDGTNFPDIDTTSGSSYIPYNYRADSFIAAKAMVANTNQLFGIPSVDLLPLLYNVYVLFRAGAAVSANWTLKSVSSQAQYT